MLPPYNPLDHPPVEVPHSWCNWLTPDGELWQTLHTSDDWAYAVMIQVHSDGAHVHFFKRTAPLVFTHLGGFIEGLEKTEEWFAKVGLDIAAWAAWIRRYHVTTWAEGQPDHEAEQNGVLLGGPTNAFYIQMERFYAAQPANPA